MKYYTIFLGDELWENEIDDMNSTKIWSHGGMLWTDRKKAEACMENLKHPAYNFEKEEGKKFGIVELCVNG
ncbi:MAG: hypothetical protein MUP81_03195 [Dehalococcoidia bacterium]|nr:hypothetical protein [Dehalococcoidia bacterium]